MISLEYIKITILRKKLFVKMSMKTILR